MECLSLRKVSSKIQQKMRKVADYLGEPTTSMAKVTANVKVVEITEKLSNRQTKGCGDSQRQEGSGFRITGDTSRADNTIVLQPCKSTLQAIEYRDGSHSDSQTWSVTQIDWAKKSKEESTAMESTKEERWERAVIQNKRSNEDGSELVQSDEKSSLEDERGNKIRAQGSPYPQKREKMNPQDENGRTNERRGIEPKELRKMRSRKTGARKEDKQRLEKPCEDERNIMTKMMKAIRRKGKKGPSSIWVIPPSHSKNMLALVKIAIL